MDKINNNVMAAFWSWLGNEQNRKILAWIGSGVVVVISGLWVAFQSPGGKSSTSTAKSSPAASSVIASEGSVAAGGNITIGGNVTTIAPPAATDPTPQ
ncbi:MAG: hypothetical protein ABFS39_09860 [Pseudomonadota bacterium]